MGLFDRLTKRADEPTTTNDMVDDVVLSSLLTGDLIDAKKALTIPAVASAVSRIATLVAVLPIKLYKHEVVDGKPTTTEVTDDNRTYLLNIDSGDTLDQFAIKRNLAKDYLLEKGAFLYIKKAKGEVSELRYVPPASVTAVVNDVNPLNKDGQYLVLGHHYDQFEFISVLRDTDDGFLGTPLTKQINDVLSSAVSNILYELGVSIKGGTKKGFITSEKVLSNEAMKKLKQAWRELYSNTSENVIVLNSGLKFEPASDNSVDLQLDQRKNTLYKELTAVFGIHSDKFDDVFRDAVLPVLEAIESALNKNLLKEDEKKTHYFAFDKREILKAGLKERYESYKLASETGWLTKNEIRETENLAPIDGMDVVSMGLGDVIYDVKTKEYFTPNTGATKTFDDDENADDTADEEEAK